MLKQTVAIAAVLASTLTATAASPQEPQPTQIRSADPRTMLKLTVVLSRFQGEKKVGSLPYTLTIATGERANLRMGSEVPMVTAVFGGGGDKPAQTSYTYRNLGTNIDCIASSRPIDGAYLVSLTIEDTSVHLDPAKPSVAAQKADVPSYRTFKTNFSVLMRDGQTLQNTSAADPITGEIMKVDATLNVLK